MTVCTASLFYWFYGPDDFGPAVIAASDRMLTDVGLGVEYEGSHRKAAFFGPHHMVLVSGDLSFCSLALQALNEHYAGSPPESTAQLAIALGDIIGRLNGDRAARKYLNPLGLSPSVIKANPKGLAGFGLPDALIEQLAGQMQTEKAGIDAIVIGHDARIANIYHVDGEGIFSSHIDIGFLSIGTGAVHASSHFMQLPYKHQVGYHTALRSTFFAKKAAEAAPGVGQATDIFLCTADAITLVSVEDMRILESGYKRYRRSVEKFLVRLTERLGRKHQGADVPSDAGSSERRADARNSAGPDV